MSLKLDFPAIQTRLTAEEIAQLAEAIARAKTLTMGPYLQEFERNFAEYIGSRYAFGVCNATAALDLAAMILDIGPGDEVILPAHTFTATALGFMRKGCRLVFADIDPETFVMDIDDVVSKITPKTRVVVPVHLYGLPVQMDALMEVAEQHNLYVVEDCAQAPGAKYKGKAVGTFGDFGCFSFHSQKNITTLGEGGMIVTDNSDYAEKILGLRKIGQRPFANQTDYWIPAMTNIIEAVPGAIPHNYALGEIQAFAGNLLLKRLDKQLKRRLEIRNRIVKSLTHHPELIFQKIPSECVSALHLLPARVSKLSNGAGRDELIRLLYNKYKIKCVVQYYPLYRYELFQRHGYVSADCPQTDEFFDNMISFPFGSDMTDEEVDYLIASVDAALNELKGKA
ncbi:MAG: DegT/DnrJ/EryC1/StrS family aminotransferase [candidate division KSB1 bacterium]|nr:DegT/DnrJ/EryC1/StrS family aminotransferase [candidate division KSB1 bacterium]